MKGKDVSEEGYVRCGGWWFPEVPTIPTQIQFKIGYRLDRLKASLAILEHEKLAAVDVGAHVGAWTVALAKEFEIVHSFEPHPDLFQCLGKNVAFHGAYHQQLTGKRFGDVSLTQAGCGREAKQASIAIKKHTISAFIGEPGEGVPVKLVRLDDAGLKCDFLKLHCNGMELEALEGGRALVEAHKPVIHMVLKHLPNEEQAAAAEFVCREFGYRVAGCNKPDWTFAP